MLLTYVFEFCIILLNPNMQTFLSLVVGWLGNYDTKNLKSLCERNNVLVCVYLWLCFALFKLITELLGMFNLFPFSTTFCLHLSQLIKTWNHQSSHSGLQPLFSFDSLFESLKLKDFFFPTCNAFLGVGFWKEQIDLNFLLHLSGGLVEV